MSNSLDPLTNLPDEDKKKRTASSIAKELTNYEPKERLVETKKFEGVDIPEIKTQLAKGRDYAPIQLEKEGNRLSERLKKARLEEQRIKFDNQTPLEQVGNFLGQVGGEIVGGTLEGFGYVFDIAHWVDRLQGEEGDWGNWLSDFGKDIKETTREELPIYENPYDTKSFNPASRSWWLNNGVSVASTLSILIPTTAVAKGVSLLGKAAKLGKTVDKVAKASEVSKWAVQGVAQASLSRHIENMMEANGIFEEQYQRFKDAGFSEQDAKEKASDAAATVYRANWAMLAQDIPQYMLMGRGLMANRNIVSGKVAKKVGEKAGAARLRGIGRKAFDYGSEGFEEAYQYIVGEEAKYMSDLEAGLVDESSRSKRIGEYLRDGEMWTSAFFGAFGAGVTQAVGRPLMNKLFKDYADESQKIVNEHTSRASRRAMYTKKMQEAAEAGDAAAYEQARIHLATDMGIKAAEVGSLDRMIKELESFKNMTEEEKEANGITEEFEKNIDTIISDVQRIGKIWNENARKLDPEFVMAATESRFVLEKLGAQRNELEQAVLDAEEAFPRVSVLTATGRQVLNAHANIRAREQAINVAKERLEKDKDLTADEKENLEAVIKESELQVEESKKVLEEATKNKGKLDESGSISIDPLLPNEKKVFKGIENSPLLNDLVSAKQKLIWADALADSHITRLEKIGSKKFQEKVKDLKKKNAKLKETNVRLKDVYSQLTDGIKTELTTDVDESGQMVNVQKSSPLTAKEKYDLYKEAKELYIAIKDDAEKERLKPMMEELERVVNEDMDKFNRARRRVIATEKAKIKRAETRRRRALNNEFSDAYEEIRKEEDIRFSDIKISELFLSNEDVIPAFKNDKRGVLFIDPETKEYIFESEGEQTIVAAGGNRQQLDELGISIPKDSYYPVDMKYEADGMTIWVGDHSFRLGEMMPLGAMNFDESGNLKSIKLLDIKGNEIEFTDKALTYDIADLLYLYQLNVEQYFEDANGIITADNGKTYRIEYNLLEPTKSKVFGDSGELLPGKGIRKKDGDYNLKGRILNQFINKFNEEVLAKLDPSMKKSNPHAANNENKIVKPDQGQGTEETISSDDTRRASEISASEKQEEINLLNEQSKQVAEEISMLKEEEGELKFAVQTLQDNIQGQEDIEKYKELKSQLEATQFNIEKKQLTLDNLTEAIANLKEEIDNQELPTGKEIENELKDQATAQAVENATSSINEAAITSVDDTSDMKPVGKTKTGGTVKKNNLGATEIDQPKAEIVDGVLIIPESEELSENEKAQILADAAEKEGLSPQDAMASIVAEEDMKAAQPEFIVNEKGEVVEVTTKSEKAPEVKSKTKKNGIVELANGEIASQNSIPVYDDETNEFKYVDIVHKPNLGLIGNPNLGEGTKVKFVIEEDSDYWRRKKDELDPLNYWSAIPIYVQMQNPNTGEWEFVGKLAAGDNASIWEKERKHIYNNYLAGKDTMGEVVMSEGYDKKVSPKNIRNVRDKEGRPLWGNPSKVFSTAWQQKGNSFELARNDGKLIVLSTIGSTQFGEVDPQLYLEGLTERQIMDLSRTSFDRNGSIQDGHVWTAVVNPAGVWSAIKLSTSYLSEDAIDYAMSELIKGNLSNVNEVTFTEYSEDQFNSEGFLVARENEQGEKYIKYSIDGKVYSINYKDFLEAAKKRGKATVNEETWPTTSNPTSLVKLKDKEGKNVKTERNILEDLRSVLANKRYNIKNSRLRQPGKTYTSPITEKEYNSYEEYLMGAPAIDGSDNQEVPDSRDGRPPTILVTDVRGEDGNFYFDTGMNFTILDATEESATKEEKKDYQVLEHDENIMDITPDVSQGFKDSDISFDDEDVDQLFSRKQTNKDFLFPDDENFDDLPNCI